MMHKPDNFRPQLVPRLADVSAADCLAALARVQAELAQAQGRNRRLEREVREAQAALAKARAELVGTRAEGLLAQHQARHDGLTQLPNRSFFLERLDDAVSEGMLRRVPLALLYLDLDGFKPVNDAHGHDAGDELLRIVAARLSRVVRAEDMVSRLGGDEFGCLLAQLADRNQLGLMAAKLFTAVAAPVTIGGLELSVRPSIGIALCPTDGATSRELLRNADAAMYSAKQKGTGYAFFDRRGSARRGPLCSAARRSSPNGAEASPGR